jgi:hypothetical protein
MLREDSVGSARTTFASALAALAILTTLGACTSATTHQYGQYADLSPKVAAIKGERIPAHVTVQLSQPANVAIFYVVPGRATSLLFPEDSTANGRVDAGSHLIETSLSHLTPADTARLTRVPTQGVPNNRNPNQGQQRGRAPNARDTLPAFGYNQHGYLLIYASKQALPYKILSTRVAGLSVPIDDDDAINTVTKLVRERTQTTGTWAAYASDFPP